VNPPPRDLADLLARANDLAGRALDELAATHGIAFEGRDGAKTKGKTGELLERILGATGGAHAVHDFPELAVELKTIPVDAAMHARESTYVCTLQLTEADRAEWATSWARAKLSHVLWVPIVLDDGPTRVGAPSFWKPTRDQDAVLASDFEEAMGAVAIGGIESLTARTGRWLHVRPKAASSRDRTWSVGRDDGDYIAAVPRGFYLRPRFTTALLGDLAAMPE
jgi:DNA mismatch repair protein MutH